MGASQLTTPSRNSDAVREDLTAWLERNWDPELTVAEWWRLLGTSGWAAPTWPLDSYGKGLTRVDGVMVQRIIRKFGALGAPGGIGLMLAGPTIGAHGTAGQKEMYLRDIVTGQKAWCQLFSEPGAGSDLAGLSTSAIKDGQEWIVNGQKVWTSGAQVADLGMLLTRTDPDVPKHNGISFFAFDMHQPCIEIRPLKEMTGQALFNEVFLNDARVGEAACIGGFGNGWKVATTTLMVERASLGAGGGSEAGTAAAPGTVAGHLNRRVGDFVRAASEAGAKRTSRRSFSGNPEKALTELALGSGAIKNPVIRQDLMQIHIRNQIGRITTLRLKGGANIPGAGNLAKLAMSEIVRLQRDLGLRILGPAGTLHAYNSSQRKILDGVIGDSWTAAVTEMALRSPGPSIYGGTDQIQRNIIGERVLGLAKEPGQPRLQRFKDISKLIE